MWKYFIIFSLLVGSVSFAVLDCKISTECSNSIIFKISDTTNAHGELTNQTAYSYCVSCRETLGNDIISSCSSASFSEIATLSEPTNAHGELFSDTSTYSNSVCLSSDMYFFTIEPRQNSCTPGFACMFSLSSSTNAHFGNCTAYSTLVCAVSHKKVVGQQGQSFQPGGFVVIPNVTSNLSENETKILESKLTSVELFEEKLFFESGALADFHRMTAVAMLGSFYYSRILDVQVINLVFFLPLLISSLYFIMPRIKFSLDKKEKSGENVLLSEIAFYLKLSSARIFVGLLVFSVLDVSFYFLTVNAI